MEEKCKAVFPGPADTSHRIWEHTSQGEAEPVGSASGVYIIVCVATGAIYIGSAESWPKRLRSHISKLDRDVGEVNLMQEDWNHYSDENFKVWIYPCAEADLWWIENQLILHLHSMEDHGGYNRMVYLQWGLHARIYNTESKLVRSGKLYIPDGLRHVRLGKVYAQTFAQHVKPLSEEVAQKMADLTCPEFSEQLPAILAALQAVSIAKLRRSQTTGSAR